MDKVKIIILFANNYDIDNGDGNHTRGCSVHYLFYGEGGTSFLPQSESDISKPVGFMRAKCSCDVSIRQKILVAPAVYEGTFAMKIGSDGKPVLTLTDVAYVANLETKEKVVPGLVVPGMVQPNK